MEMTKRQNLPTGPTGLPPGLWVVATPIGNLADFSERGKLALASADWILCEDTRRTQQLLGQVFDAGESSSPLASSRGLSVSSLTKKLRRFDAHVEHQSTSQSTSRHKDARALSSELSPLAFWLKQLRLGFSVALVSDAGTPAVSDPGALLVRQAREAGIRVSPIPGASMVAALWSIAGISETGFSFLGFFPRKKSEQLALLSQLRGGEGSVGRASRAARAVRLPQAFLWFESPHRLQASLELIAQQWGEAEWVVAKELTKLHEKVIAGQAAAVLAQVTAEIALHGEKGEWAFLISLPVAKREDRLGGVGLAGGAGMEVLDETAEWEQAEGEAENGPETKTKGEASRLMPAPAFQTPGVPLDASAAWPMALECLLGCGVSVREASQKVSQVFQVPKRVVYAAALASQKR